MSQDETWRSETAYDYIEALTPGQIAWEFLRRNPEYRKAFQEFVSNGRISQQDAVAFAEQWGLRFPGRTTANRHRAADLLDPRNRPWRDPAPARFRAAGKLPPYR
ncbi:transcriptional regulator domain-containing protein [Neorhizobium sp. DT-125]|uniref:transcriptional regulator domain-containing protein n=1 Tax=Neorhizobium sp. DT-125 TaxID=3396163 RepID=UPI003F19E986